MESPAQLTPIIDRVQIPALTAEVHELIQDKWCGADGIGSFKPPYHAACVKVDGMQVHVIRADEDMTFGNLGGGADWAVGIVGPRHFAGTHPDDVKRLARIIERNAVAQLRIVEDLLDVQRMLKGKLRIEPEELDLSQLSQTVMESLDTSVAAKGVHWSGHFEPEPLVIKGDRARIQQVLWNLLTNALKFTPSGGCIGVSAVREDSTAVLRVEDSGEGIPPHFLPHLFEPFRQADMSTTRRHSGLGMGLAIVKNIVQSHGGEVSAHSPGIGVGALFTVTFPIRP